MTERGIDHGSVRHGGHQFLGTDRERPAPFRQQPFIRGRIKFEQRAQVPVIVGNPRQDAVSTGQLP